MLTHQGPKASKTTVLLKYNTLIIINKIQLKVANKCSKTVALLQKPAIINTMYRLKNKNIKTKGNNMAKYTIGEKTTKPWSKAWYAKGRSLYELGQENEGIIALQTANQKQPGTEGALMSHKMLAEIFHNRGNVELSELHRKLGDADITVDE